jgi:hypothetical protein
MTSNLLISLTFGCAVACWPSTVSAQVSPSPPCIAIVMPSVQGVEGDATAVGGSVRELFASFLRGPSLQVVLLEARLASHAVDEARQKGCARVLSIVLARKGGSGRGSAVGRIVGQAGSYAAWGLPVGGIGGAVARGATVATAQAISELASSTRVRDEMRLDYKVVSLDGTTALGPKTENATAKVDGEDLLTPMTQRAAEAIVAVSK